LQAKPVAELKELTRIYEGRGLGRTLASEVARELTAHDALATHLRDELGIHDATRARPLQAAFASAGAFCVGALPPLALAALWTGAGVALAVSTMSVVLLAVL